jgi:transcriptional regulator with XRE-family HTH domain
MDGKGFAARLQSQRSKLELTQKQMAFKLGVPQTTYREWEYGRRILNPEMLLKISSVCQISLHELITGEKVKPNQQIREIDQILNE